jgi:hypothetical protein
VGLSRAITVRKLLLGKRGVCNFRSDEFAGVNDVLG